MSKSNHQGALRRHASGESASSHNSIQPAHPTAAQHERGEAQRSYPAGVSSGNAGVTFVRPLAARDVPVGQCWGRRDHRTMAEVMASEGGL